MIYYDGTLIGGFDPDLAYEEAAEIAAETRQRKKLLDFYYDCTAIVDRDVPLDPIQGYKKEIDLHNRLNKFFMDNLNKSL